MSTPNWVIMEDDGTLEIDGVPWYEWRHMPEDWRMERGLPVSHEEIPLPKPSEMAMVNGSGQA